jgi:hypothetical protein
MRSVRCRILMMLPAFILGMCLSPPKALAGDTEKSWEFGGFLPYSHYAGGTHIDDGFGIGGRAGYHFKALHELEGSLDRVSADSKSVPGVSLDITKIRANYLHMFAMKGHEKISPTVSFGISLIQFDDGSDTASSAAYGGGGGFKYFFKPRIAFRFDVLIYRSNGDGTVVPRDPFFAMDTLLGVSFMVGGSK